MSKQKYSEMPTQARLHDLFDYRDGVLYYKQDHRRARAGDRAGGNSQTNVIVDGRAYSVRRLVWAWHHGICPAMDIIRLNGDNRIENLRLATRQQSCFTRGLRSDSQSGFKGVTLAGKTGKWNAVISVNRRNLHLGTFDTKEEAHAAYCATAMKYHGEFANFGIHAQHDRPPQKDAPPSSGQMTEGAGATDLDSMAQGANEANHSVALTDNAPAVQAPARKEKRQTAAADSVTGKRYCKRCNGHRKSDGGTHLNDALNRCYWVCQACTEGYHAQCASGQSDGLVSGSGRAQA